METLNKQSSDKMKIAVKMWTEFGKVIDRLISFSNLKFLIVRVDHRQGRSGGMSEGDSFSLSC